MFAIKNRSCKQLLYIVTFTMSTAVFFFHCYKIISRHFKYEIFEIHKLVYNDSLPMPLVKLELNSQRSLNNSCPYAEMSLEASMDRNPVPNWAIWTIHSRTKGWWADTIIVNAVKPSNYDVVKSLGQWPLRTKYATGKKDSGFRIYGYLNATNFIDNQKNREGDSITMRLFSFDADPNDLTTTRGITEYFELLPCDDLSIAIRLQQYKLLDRSESPCLYDYPSELKELLQNPIQPEDFFNSILAPDLPYDPGTCEDMCVVKHWLPICNCFMSVVIWYYAGGARMNYSICPDFKAKGAETNCISKNIYQRTRDQMTRCKCYKRCEGNAIMVTAYDKIQHKLGSNIDFHSLRLYKRAKLCMSLLLGSQHCSDVENSRVSFMECIILGRTVVLVNKYEVI